MTFGERFSKGAEAAWVGLKTLTSEKDVFKAMDTVHDKLKPTGEEDSDKPVQAK
jgi:malate synthase